MNPVVENGIKNNIINMDKSINSNFISFNKISGFAFLSDAIFH
jgi:hypothetical protein